MIETMDSTLRKVLSQANADQNQSYPPRVFSEHFNIVSDFILDEVNRLFPTNRSVKDIASPFLRVLDVKVINGVITIPADAKHVLGLTIFIDLTKNSACEKPEGYSQDDIDKSRLSKRIESQDVIFKEQFEYNKLTSSRYKKPKLSKPICCKFKDKEIRISPYNVPMVEMSYLVEPKKYRYGYKMNADDTYYWDPAATIESEWETTAASYLFKGVNVLYANYVRDQEQVSGAQALKQIGLL